MLQNSSIDNSPTLTPALPLLAAPADPPAAIALPGQGAIASFAQRHIGPEATDTAQMLAALGYDSLEALIEAVIPADIRQTQPLNLPPARSEYQALQDLRAIARQNQIYRSFIGLGYADCITPPVIQRNILENPNWYTAYTPYPASVTRRPRPSSSPTPATPSPSKLCRLGRGPWALKSYSAIPPPLTPTPPPSSGPCCNTPTPTEPSATTGD